MKKITYLFGAGASFNSVPIAIEFADSLKGMAIDLGNIELSEESTSLINKKKLHEKFMIDLNWLSNISDDLGSVDVAAKKFFDNSQHKDLYRLKNTLSFYLILEQSRNKTDSHFFQKKEERMSNLDKRYIKFLSVISNDKSNKLPTHIKVLT